jgi:hypothetical protein
MGKKFWWQMIGMGVGVAVAALVAWFLLSHLYYRFGAIGALLVIAGIGLIFAYRHDKKSQQEYDELP